MKRNLLHFVLVVIVVLSGCGVCCNSDSPDCPCFHDGGLWDPSSGALSSSIQDIAFSTLDTRESCVPDGGKPYYQMRLGCDDRVVAQVTACLLEAFPSMFDGFERDAWCSEAVSYWHREAEIPYSTGYRNSTWLMDWQHPNTESIRTFYTIEEATGGRGRWIESSELDYEDLQLGVNAPVPGAYVLIRRYDTSTNPPSWDGHSHSLIINEMTIHQDASGEIVRVEASLIEGNAGNRVLASAIFDDLLSLTPDYDDFIPEERKILGFGIDLGPDGSPIYDRDRVHWAGSGVSGIVRPMKAKKVEVRDPLWEKHYAARISRLVSYAKKVHKGVHVSSSSSIVRANAVPDGHGVYWLFPTDIDNLEPKGVEITIDLLDEHPLPIKGIVLNWGEGSKPQGYSVQWSGADGRFQDGAVPKFDIGNLPKKSKLVLPVSVKLSESGAAVRYVKLSFPPRTFTGKARLEELRFIYDWGPGKDAEYNPCEETKKDMQKK
jgi:hypothetical protein